MFIWKTLWIISRCHLFTIMLREVFVPPDEYSFSVLISLSGIPAQRSHSKMQGRDEECEEPR